MDPIRTRGNNLNTENRGNNTEVHDTKDTNVFQSSTSDAEAVAGVEGQRKELILGF